MGGMVLETNMNEIITQVDAQNKMEKSEVPVIPSSPLWKSVVVDLGNVARLFVFLSSSVLCLCL